ncbi:acyl--CoA ligase [Candidatus Gottesmanbacteria bacterium]|nr:acyl--CoA ligase [Candidatus Gottesmanbacteria bacterium]
MKTSIPGVPIPVESVEKLIARHAKNTPEKAAIIAVNVDTDEAETISYKRLEHLVRRSAGWLTSLGIGRGDRFAILMHNAPEVLILELAGALIGAPTVPLDSKRDTPERKRFKLTDTGAKVLFVKDDQSDLQTMPDILVQRWSTFEEFEGMLPESSSISPTGTFEDHYVILYTSGTTALPKGVLLTTRACLLNAMGIIAWQKFTQDDVFNIVLPLHHINSTEFCLAMLLVGGTIILNSRYSASKFWHIVHTYNVTNTSIVPTILHDLLVRQNEFFAVPTLKRICIGSAPVLPEETIRFYDTFGVRVTQGYGQTETALRVAGVPIDISETEYQKIVKSNTIGTELANNHLAIMDADNNEKKEGEEGEICIAGPVLADGYLNNPDETARSFKDSWFHSGDLGTWKMINGKRYFYIIGRIKEIIIKGGVNLSPSAIEDALLKSFPEIDEVSVVGYPDARMGEEIAAVVVSKKRFILPDQVPGLSPYETPKKLFFVEGLPKTSTGKIQRVEVKKSVAELVQGEHPKHYYARQITAEEANVIKKALKINNARFPFVPSTLKEFIARTHNGLFWGVFEESEGLVGSLSCLLLNHGVVEKLKTWNKTTDNGTLANHDPQGDTLLCVAISVELTRSNLVSKQGSTLPHNEKLRRLGAQHIEEYVKSGNDPVLEFHRKSKGGIPGASVWKILKNGRPEDEEAMGYNVLMKYPAITEETKIVRSNAPSPAILLIEHALLWAKEHGIKEVIAFSRPSGFKKFLSGI